MLSDCSRKTDGIYTQRLVAGHLEKGFHAVPAASAGPKRDLCFV